MVSVVGLAPKDITDNATATFMAEVVDASFNTPVLAYFWAPWAAPCWKLGPMLERTVYEASGVARMVNINVDENPGIAQLLRISAVPTVYAFVEGKPIEGFVGSLTEPAVKQLLRRLWLLKRLTDEPGAPVPIKLAMAMANRELQFGNPEVAKVLYSQVLRFQPQNVDAAVGLDRAARAAAGAEQPDGTEPATDRRVSKPSTLFSFSKGGLPPRAECGRWVL